jgi:Tfp pilus assembly protein PilF
MIKWICSCLILILSAQAGASATLQSTRENKEGVEQLKKQNFSSAERNFIKALTESPFSPELQINLGLAYYGLGQMDKAQSAYESVLKMQADPTTEFVANYNLGEMYQKAKKSGRSFEILSDSLENKSKFQGNQS